MAEEEMSERVRAVFQPFELPPDLVWERSFLAARAADPTEFFQIRSAPASIGRCSESQSSASSAHDSTDDRTSVDGSEQPNEVDGMTEEDHMHGESVMACPEGFCIGDAVSATSSICSDGILAVQRGCTGIIRDYGMRTDGTVGLSVQFHTRADDGTSLVICQQHEVEPASAAACIGDYDEGDTVEATYDLQVNEQLVIPTGASGQVKGHGEGPDGRCGVIVDFNLSSMDSKSSVFCFPAEVLLTDKASIANSFSLGDAVAATADFCIGGVAVVKAGFRGLVHGHGERPDGKRGVVVQFEKREDGSDSTVLCLPNELQIVEKAPSAHSFLVGQTVAATNEYNIGGALAVEAGCRGVVRGHGERPDGITGVVVLFEARKGGGEVTVLCLPHEIKLALPRSPPVSLATQLRMYVSGLSDTLRDCSLSILESVASWRHLSAADATAFLHGTADETISPPIGEPEPEPKPGRVPRQKPRKLQKAGVATSSAEDFDFEEYLAPQRHRRWKTIVMVLAVVNVFLAYIHMQRRSARQDQQAVKVLTNQQGFIRHVAAHPNGTLVNLFSLPCQPCALLAAEFEKAATALMGETHVSLVSVDAGRGPSFLQHHLVEGQPTLLWFRRGKFVQELSRSARTSNEIVEFVRESLQPAVIDFSTHKEFVDAVPQLRAVLAKGKTPPIVAGFGPDVQIREVLEEAGEKFRGETAFLYVPAESGEAPRIRAFFRDEADDKDYTGKLHTEDFVKWLQPFMVD